MIILSCHLRLNTKYKLPLFVSELIHGATVFSPDGTKVGESKRAARMGIFLVCVSRCIMAVPGMSEYGPLAKLPSSYEP